MFMKHRWIKLYKFMFMYEIRHLFPVFPVVKMVFLDCL